MSCDRSITFNIFNKHGKPVLEITATEVNGSIVFEVEVVGRGHKADLRALFFNLNDDSKMAGLSVLNTDSTVSDFQTGDLIDMGNGANLQGVASPFDVGLEFQFLDARAARRCVLLFHLQQFIAHDAVEAFTAAQVAHSDPAPADLVFVRGPDAPLGGADGVVALGGLAQPVDELVLGQHHVRAERVASPATPLATPAPPGRTRD